MTEDELKRAEAAQARQARLQQELKRYLELLTRDDPPERIILFGSLAEGEVGEWSDLDLVIVRKTDLPFLERSKAVLRLLHPRVGVDVLVYTPEEFERLCRERRFFQEEILDKGKVLFERNC
ncbi:MAG: nucleotidyltransferase domain-containing protein [Anaerolineae bacterium]